MIGDAASVWLELDSSGKFQTLDLVLKLVYSDKNHADLRVFILEFTVLV